ncbi:hypothetical protein [Lactiplantibacillus plantarum]|uniref:hypothetical protein n=2 Tax=Lactiplantibacillus plantarum TaxID=1590 RepID=UPI0021A4CFE6|nr:hypothetical protein [Lactiplantibacillus plantarum]MCT3275333.1 hypothetical protein [Lactiplantibacillus plantarum]
MIYATAVKFKNGTSYRTPEAIDSIYLDSTSDETWKLGKGKDAKPFRGWYDKHDVYRWLFLYMNEGLLMKVVTGENPDIKPIGKDENDLDGYVRSEKNGTVVDNLEMLPDSPSSL